MWGQLLGLLMIVSLVLFLVFWFWSGNPEPGPPEPPEAPPLMCSFDGSDLFNKRIYTATGTLVVEDVRDTCSNCSQYVYRDQDGCILLGYDESAPVCIAGFRNATGNWSVPPPKTCSFSTDLG